MQPKKQSQKVQQCERALKKNIPRHKRGFLFAEQSRGGRALAIRAVTHLFLFHAFTTFFLFISCLPLYLPLFRRLSRPCKVLKIKRCNDTFGSNGQLFTLRTRHLVILVLSGVLTSLFEGGVITSQFLCISAPLLRAGGGACTFSEGFNIPLCAP